MKIRLLAAALCLAAVGGGAAQAAARRTAVNRPGVTRRAPARRTSRAFSGWRIEHDLKPVGGVLIGAPGQFDAYYASLTSQLPRHLKAFVAGHPDRLRGSAGG